MHKDLLIAAFNCAEVKCSGKVKAKAKAMKILKKTSIEEITAKLRKKKDSGSESDIQKKPRKRTRKSSTLRKRLMLPLSTCTLRTPTTRA